MRSIICLTLLLTACATSILDVKRDPVAQAVVKTRDVTPISLDFWRVAQLQEFMSARAWRPYSTTLPSGYTGIEVQLSTKGGRKMLLSVYRHANGGAIFVSTSNHVFASSLSFDEMIRFSEIVGLERPNQAPEPTTTLVARLVLTHEARQAWSWLIFNVGQGKMNPSLPNAQSARSPEERAKIKRVIADRGLCGLANDTKWDEFITSMRAREGWRPSYRYKCVDGPVSGWDVEWFYHLPFPLLSVEWLDLSFLQEEGKDRLTAPVVTDHSASLEALLKKVGLDYRKGTSTIRIFGYSPRSMEFFDA